MVRQVKRASTAVLSGVMVLQGCIYHSNVLLPQNDCTLDSSQTPTVPADDTGYSSEICPKCVWNVSKWMASQENVHGASGGPMG